ncbi:MULTISPECIES: hypothetical protein [Mastigocoleus]|uniref:hypothetical protein n=1 Tax=Mastigocoleus TaxID=996924 RepID=UPI00092F73A0|nr:MULTISPECIES: hypothetical protein [Mastigocoleus]MDJ0693095.1 hypothetical protein [Mastigocoleus sp. MO_188.B34]
MIRALVESAFQTGCLSVESEGLLHQVLETRSYRTEDLEKINLLCKAVHEGRIKRESSSKLRIELSLYC